MRRTETGARVRFTDTYMDALNAAPLFGYWWGTVVSSNGASAQVRWADGQITTVSDVLNLTTRLTGKYEARS